MVLNPTSHILLSLLFGDVVATIMVTNTLFVPGTQLFEFAPMSASAIGVGSDGQTGFWVYASVPGASTLSHDFLLADVNGLVISFGSEEMFSCNYHATFSRQVPCVKVFQANAEDSFTVTQTFAYNKVLYAVDLQSSMPTMTSTPINSPGSFTPTEPTTTILSSSQSLSPVSTALSQTQSAITSETQPTMASETRPATASETQPATTTSMKNSMTGFVVGLSIMGVIIVILIILLITVYLRKSRLQASNAILTDSYLTPYIPLDPFTGSSEAVFAPTAFQGRTKNINAEIPFRSNASQPKTSRNPTAREEIRLLRDRMVTFESRLPANASASAMERSGSERLLRSATTTISEAVPMYSEN